jgi:hypothetical protein
VTARAPLSISDATTWSQGFLRREWRLTLPVAFALVALPAIAFDLLAAPPQGETEIINLLLTYVVIATPLALMGMVAISALTLLPGMSVGEGLRLALRRFPAALGTALLVSGANIVSAVLAGLIVFMIGGVPNPGDARQTAPAVTMMTLVMIAVLARLCLFPAVVAAEGVGPIASVRRSWALSRGHFWRLFSLLLIVMVASAVVSRAAQWSFGVPALLLGRGLGVEEFAVGVLGIIAALVNATIMMLVAVLLAAVYRQLASRGI